jgi:hypothetical protein
MGDDPFPFLIAEVVTFTEFIRLARKPKLIGRAAQNLGNRGLILA